MAARFGKILIFAGAFFTPGELRVVGDEGSTLTACSSFFFGAIVDKMVGRTKEERTKGGEEGRTKERKKRLRLLFWIDRDVQLRWETAQSSLLGFSCLKAKIKSWRPTATGLKCLLWGGKGSKELGRP
jgi:hypothetical protein